MTAPKIDLTLYTEEELIELNRKVVDRLRFMRDAKAHHQMLELRLGDKVFFTSEQGQRITGTLIKLNRKTVSLCTHDGHHWRVSPSLLTRAEPKDVQAEVEPKKTEPPKQQAPAPPTVIPLTTALFQTSFSQDVPRNAPCPCRSGKKYKRCCLNRKEALGR